VRRKGLGRRREKGKRRRSGRGKRNHQEVLVEERDILGHVDPWTLFILSISCRYSYSIHLL
jgi:hypothetical protein